MRTYSLGHHQRMYDNPVYRWRESLAIALSRMQTPPLHGYLAYRSIRNHLVEHGLSLVAGEADAISTPDQRRALVRDQARMNQLIQDASRVPIDPGLEPVILTGNELGLADYFYWAFRIFGLNVKALALFYYSILFVSVVLFFMTFRRSPFCQLLLMLYLAGHLFAVNYATIPLIQVIHNSRFFPVLALLPAMHILLLMLRREPASLANILAAAGQAFILLFLMFCRSQVSWQVVAILASALLVVRFRDVWRALPQPRHWPGTIATAARDTWPALLVLCGLAGYIAYSSRAPDPGFYGSESKTHVFWHTLYVGMISADRELTSRYGYGEEPYSDSMGYFAAMHDLRGRNEVPPGLAEVVDGVVNINILKSTGAYDRVVRRIFFQVVAEHPWLVLRSFLVGKPKDQFSILFGERAGQSTPVPKVPQLWDWRVYIEVLVLGSGASLLALFAGATFPHRNRLREAAIALVPLVICSAMTTLVVPSAVIPDVIVFYLVLVLLVTTYLPLALLSERLSATIAKRSASSAPELEDGAECKGPTSVA